MLEENETLNYNQEIVNIKAGNVEQEDGYECKIIRLFSTNSGGRNENKTMKFEGRLMEINFSVHADSGATQTIDYCSWVGGAMRSPQTIYPSFFMLASTDIVQTLETNVKSVEIVWGLT